MRADRLLVLLLAAVGCGRAAEGGAVDARAVDAGATVALGAPAPRYAVTTLAGERVEVGVPDEPLTLLNVWATWCTSCREEMADLDALHRAYAARGVRVVAVSIDAGSTARVRRFAERQQLALRVAHDADARVQSAFHVAGVPSTYLVGRDGRLRWMQVGGIHGATAAARAAIDEALAAP